jgi:hypothetical protein
MLSPAIVRVEEQIRALWRPTHRFRDETRSLFAGHTALRTGTERRGSFRQFFALFVSLFVGTSRGSSQWLSKTRASRSSLFVRHTVPNASSELQSSQKLINCAKARESDPERPTMLCSGRCTSRGADSCFVTPYIVFATKRVPYRSLIELPVERMLPVIDRVWEEFVESRGGWSRVNNL